MLFYFTAPERQRDNMSAAELADFLGLLFVFSFKWKLWTFGIIRPLLRFYRCGERERLTFVIQLK